MHPTEAIVRRLAVERFGVPEAALAEIPAEAGPIAGALVAHGLLAGEAAVELVVAAIEVVRAESDRLAARASPVAAPVLPPGPGGWDDPALVSKLATVVTRVLGPVLPEAEEVALPVPAEAGLPSGLPPSPPPLGGPFPLAGPAAPPELGGPPPGSFGALALQKGLLTEEQLAGALRAQQEERARGRQKLLGVILQEQMILTEEQVDEVSAEMVNELARQPIRGYHILRALGRGRLGSVWEGREEATGRRVALRILSPRHVANPEWLARFLQGTERAAQVSHPRLVSIYGTGESWGYHFMAMEYLPDGSLVERLAREGRLPPDEVVGIAEQALEGLAFLEERRVIHGDLKPSNLRRAPDGSLKLADLGLAALLRRASALTGGGAIYGSSDYVSPEQIAGREDLDGRSDLYALGATLFHLLAGEPPYRGNSARDVLLGHVKSPVPDPAAEAPGTPPALASLVRQLLAKDRGARPASAAEAMAFLSAARAEGRPPGTKTRQITKRLLGIFTPGSPGPPEPPKGQPGSP
ncbi:MAG: serine/threonine protein kinase [Planctomycetales bacterium]|nr:serine/threonine protein kinase [Planctomycetales bacterium]